MPTEASDTEVQSIRSFVMGHVRSVVDAQGLMCERTTEAITALVVDLPGYEEEGVRLYPSVLVCDDLTTTARSLQLTQATILGRGERGAATMRAALKKCAPLADRGWVVFVERRNGDFVFGVVAEPYSPTSLDIGNNIIIGEGLDHVVLIRASGEKTVELLGGSGARLAIRLSDLHPDTTDESNGIDQLVESATSRLTDHRAPTSQSLRMALLRGIQRSHGAIVLVVDNIDQLETVCKATEADPVDAVALDPPLDLWSLSKDFEAARDNATLGRLASSQALLEGLLACDGMVVLSSRAEVLAYNAFVRAQGQAEQPSHEGGARRRAFTTICTLISAGQPIDVLFHSNDGTTMFAGRHEE